MRLVHALLASIMPVLNSFVLLGLVTAIYASMAVGLFGEKEPLLFGKLSAAMFTMFQVRIRPVCVPLRPVCVPLRPVCVPLRPVRVPLRPVCVPLQTLRLSVPSPALLPLPVLSSPSRSPTPSTYSHANRRPHARGGAKQ